MHFAISTTWGPTDPTRAMLPFIFAASAAVQAGDTVTLMLFHDAVLAAVDGVGATLVPVGPPNRYEEVVGHPNVTCWACEPCVDVRGLAGAALDSRIKLGGHERDSRRRAPAGYPRRKFLDERKARGSRYCSPASAAGVRSAFTTWLSTKSER